MNKKIPKGWRKVKLGEIASIKNGKSNSCEAVKDGIYTFFDRSKQIKKSNRFLFDTTAIIVPGEGKEFIPRFFKGKFDLHQRAYAIFNFQNNVFPKYIYYYILFSHKYFKSVSVGSTVMSLRIQHFLEYPIHLPPLEEQKEIANVLSCLDDKIELLHKQNKTLEAMAETLFRKWFIKNAKKDWEKVSLGDSDLSKIIKSGIDKFNGKKLYLATSNVKNTKIIGGEEITYKERPSRANMQPMKFSVWFAKKYGVRKLIMFDDYSNNINNIILSTGFVGLKTTELSHYYIWCFILSKKFQKIKDSFVSGSVQPDINNDSILKILIPKPDKKTLIKFNKTVKSLFVKIQINQQQILTLEKLRDILLPKLMTGEIRVKQK